MEQLLGQIRAGNIELRVDGNQLRIVAPKGALTADLRAAITENKDKLLALLCGSTAREEHPKVTPRPELNHEPFALTHIQSAYWLGRNDYVEFGGIAAHVYCEFDREGLDFQRLESSLQKVIARHGMLRAEISNDGYQRILPEVPPYRIALHDLSFMSSNQREAELTKLRQSMSHKRSMRDSWPLFDIRAALQCEGCLRIFVSLDLLTIDASSMFIFCSDWQRFYENPDWSPVPLTLSYRDYAEFESGLPSQPAFQRAKNYWTNRLHKLPPAPNLPTATSLGASKQVEFVRRYAALSLSMSVQLKKRVQLYGGTVSSFLMTVFSDVVRAWSRDADFTLNVTIFNRLPVHPEVNELIGDFTSTVLLAVQAQAGESFLDRFKRLKAQLAVDLEYNYYSGMRVMRDRARLIGDGASAAMPVVFTSILSADSRENITPGFAFWGKYVYGLSQTPQVWLDSQVKETNGQLEVFWDSLDAVFPPGMLDDMFGAYVALLKKLAEDDRAWTQTEPLPILPEWQEKLLLDAHNTKADIPQATLHGLVMAQALRQPDAIAVIAEDTNLTYSDIHRHAFRLARYLRNRGVERNTLVAVSMEKGWEQVAAVLGILHAGAAYLPIDPGLPQARRWRLTQQGQINVVVTQSFLSPSVLWPDALHIVTLDDEEIKRMDDAPLVVEQPPTDLAYVIFTSGSTGEPKGVMIEHHSAANTVQDINQRYGVSPQDRVLALSALGFDLSVYDIFGVLAAGGTLVMPAPNGLADPAYWSSLIERHRVTLWNSVPQLLQIWVDFIETSGTASIGHAARTLRLALLSGDWIPVPLPDRARALCPQLKVISLGGATEASIWSIYYPIGQVDSAWKSIPYGKALANQSMHVLNNLMQPCPVWTVGHIYIGGIGVAAGYWRDSERTAQRFITHPVSGERLYRTGDLGRLLPDGNIEFLGRDDFQVKINGYRIELGEIEAALRRQPGINQAIVTVQPAADGRPGQLVAYVVPEVIREFAADRIAAALTALLPEYMLPRHYVPIEALPLSANGKLDYKALPALQYAAKENERRPPSTPDEQHLFDIWKEILKYDRFGIDDNFFSLGADSLNMVQAVAKISTDFKLEGIPRQSLLRHFYAGPTIAAFAAVLKELKKENKTSDTPTEKLPEVVADRDNWHAPFPMCSLQMAYLAGQMEEMEFHSRASYYFEFDYDEAVDPVRFEHAFNAMLKRQQANLPVLNKDMQLEVPRVFEPVRLQVNDLCNLRKDEVLHNLQRIRDSLARIAMPLDRWPWIALQISLHENKARLHVNISNFFLDAFSVLRFNDLKHYYDDPDCVLPELTISYRDAVLTYEKIQASSFGKNSERYWRDRLPSLPRAPSVPLVTGEDTRSASMLHRREHILPEKTWSAFKQRAQRYGITATTAVYAAYAEILAFWSGTRHFILSNMLTHRLPLHPEMRDIMGNFAAVYPLEFDGRETSSFYDRAQKLQIQAAQDTQHLYWSSAKIWQALNQISNTPGRAVSPFVIASGLDLPARSKPAFGCLATPQVLIDHQFWNLADGGMWTIWDVNERFFPLDAVDAMWNAYRDLLVFLAEDEQAWLRESFDLLHVAQFANRPELGTKDIVHPLTNSIGQKPQARNRTIVPPRTPTEVELIAILEQVLSVSPIGIKDDFFDLGGQSFAAIQVITRIEQRFGHRLPLAALLKGRTVESLAHNLEQALGTTAFIKKDKT